MAAGANRGNPRKPTELKLLNGNPGKRKIKNDEVKPLKVMKECPDWLHKYAKEEWMNISGTLLKLGLLTEIDYQAFAAYCQSYARWREAEENLNEFGTAYALKTGYIQQSPQVAMAHKNLSLMGYYLSKFGMSPSDRAGLVVDAKNDEESEMEKLLKKAK